MPYNPIVIPMSVASDSEALEMSVAVSIGGGSILGTKEITANGVYNAAADGYDGYSSVDVQVSGGSATLGEKTVTANGVYNASSDSLDGYSKVTVSVPASAVDSGTKNINTNGTHDVIGYASANVSVPASAVDSGTKSITANGNNQDVVGYAAVNVNVPNTYSAGDEGKVVSNGELVAQTSDTVTENDTYDTTLINSLTVNVSGSSVKTATGTFTGDDSASAKFSCSFEPDAVYIKRINVASLTVRVFGGFIGGQFGTEKGYISFQNNANTTAFSIFAGDLSNRGFSYSNGIVSASSQSTRPVSSNCEYFYYAVKWTE